MRAASLLLVFLLAKAAMVWGHAPHITPWWPIAYLWQDALVAGIFAALDLAIKKPQITWTIYWLAAIYAAINIPVGRAVSSPLTRPMLRAARGPLSDSIFLYITATNILLVLTVLAMAAALPHLLTRVPRQFGFVAAACALLAILLGPTASRRVDTHGMDRNVFLALIGPSSVTGHPSSANWRTSRFETTTPTTDLSRLHAAARGFNIVMVSLESTAAQYLSLYGGEYEVMPNLSALAQHALVFDNAYAVYPESIKGLFSVLCSQYPAFDTQPEQYENVDCQSLPTMLAAGYRTAMFHSGRFAYLGMESIVRHRGYQTLEDAGDIGGNHNSSFGVDEPATVQRMLAWIDALPRGENFFLTYLPIAGHHPYATPEPGGPFNPATELNQYRNALHYGDVSLGAFIAALRARGLDRNTLWIVYGDHGEAFHQHEGNYGHTFFLYEENVHVPFLIAAPALLDHQQRVPNVVSLVDTAPTILDLLGIAPPENYQGRTMLDGAPKMALFFADYSLGLLGLRDGPWKFIYELGSGRPKLFNLAKDPRETTDLSPTQSTRSSYYIQVLQDWSSAQQTSLARRAN